MAAVLRRVAMGMTRLMTDNYIRSPRRGMVQLKDIAINNSPTAHPYDYSNVSDHRIHIFAY